ncbi:hypothetical protein ACFCYN_04510 [Gottfriedia sp. NPDC056225]|uniref:hypothetical protein n=1 Tax=Gottfriedia sp. NPDC056225 TaxID=3345751 RepID=UPI0035D9B2FC
MENKDPLTLFVKISQHRMVHHYLPKLIQAVQELDSHQLWSKEGSCVNSVGGIVLHICEHVKRNTIRFSDPNNKGFVKGIEDIFPESDISSQELFQQINESFTELNEVMKQLIDNLPNEIDMHSLYHLVEHTGYHLGQIVDRSKRLLHKSFDFCQNGLSEQSLRTMIEEDK